MSLTSPFLRLTLPTTSPFLRGSLPIPTSKPPTLPSPPPTHLPLRIESMKKMQGRVVCATNDKTVAVEVVRLAPHPKYKRRVRKKKTFQAHDPDNAFNVGDLVQLERSRPISKNKCFLAVPVPPRNTPRSDAAAADSAPPEAEVAVASQ